jgi:NADH dehydrogenase
VIWVVTRGCHLIALPANRSRTVADRLFTAVGSRPSVQLGLTPGPAVPLDTDAPELVHPAG